MSTLQTSTAAAIQKSVKALPADTSVADHAHSLVIVGLADALRTVGRLPRTRADSAARELVKNERSSDYLAEIRRLWPLPPEKFLAGLYRAILHRSPDVSGTQWFLEQLNRGATRAEIVTAFATSEEARLQDIPTQWLSSLPAEGVQTPAAPATDSGSATSNGSANDAAPSGASPTEPKATRAEFRHAPADNTSHMSRISVTPLPPAQPAAAPADSVLGQIRSAGWLGKAARYARRVIYLPWNFQKFFDDYLAFRTSHRQFEAMIFERLWAIDKAQGASANELALMFQRLESGTLRAEDTLQAVRQLHPVLEKSLALSETAATLSRQSMESGSSTREETARRMTAMESGLRVAADRRHEKLNAELASTRTKLNYVQALIDRLAKTADEIGAGQQAARGQADTEASALRQQLLQVQQSTKTLEAFTEEQRIRLQDTVVTARDALDAVKVVKSDLGGGFDFVCRKVDALSANVQDAWDAVKVVKTDLGGGFDFVCRKVDALSTTVQDSLDTAKVVKSDLGGGFDFVCRKVDALSTAVREQMSTGMQATQMPEPTVRDADALRARIAALGGIKLNLGCGERPLPAYVNVDARPMTDVDIVADVRRLPFESGTVDEIASSHLVEHFRQAQLLLAILPYWKSLLKPGGTLRITCPNWRAMLDRLASGKMSYPDFRLVTFGGQDYEGDDHFSMYTPDSLTELLKQAGFTDVRVVTPERMNGLCPEMELTARK